MWLVCRTCSQPYDMPVVDGVYTISVDTLTTLQTSEGSHLRSMCPTCCDALTVPAVIERV